MQAAQRAGEWADLMLSRGDRNGHAAWRRVLWAIEDVRHRSLRERQEQSARERRRPQVPRLYSGIDAPLERIIRTALAAARERGRDDLTQTEEALRAARQARPALSVPDALSAVAFARRR